MCLRQFISKALREVLDIAPMGQWELAHLCLILGRSKALSKYGGITPMFLRPLWIETLRKNGGIAPMRLKLLRIKTLKEVWDIATMGQWLLRNIFLKDGCLPMHKNGKELKYTSASQQGGCKQKIKNMIVDPHHPKANVGVVLINQYYQQIIRWQEQQLICCVKKSKQTTHISGGARTINILV